MVSYPWPRTHTHTAACASPLVSAHVSPCLCFIGGKGTFWPTWNPRGNWDRPSGTQGTIFILLFWEMKSWEHNTAPVSHPAFMSLPTNQGAVGYHGPTGPSGPQGLGEPGPPVSRKPPPEFTLGLWFHTKAINEGFSFVADYFRWTGSNTC